MRNRMFPPILMAATLLVALPVRAEGQNPQGTGQQQAGGEAAPPAIDRRAEAKKALKAIRGPGDAQTGAGKPVVPRPPAKPVGGPEGGK